MQNMKLMAIPSNATNYYFEALDEDGLAVAKREGKISELSEAPGNTLLVTNKDMWKMLNKYAKQRSSFTRYWREMEALRKQNNSPEIQNVSTKMWAALYFGFAEFEKGY